LAGWHLDLSAGREDCQQRATEHVSLWHTHMKISILLVILVICAQLLIAGRVVHRFVMGPLGWSNVVRHSFALIGWISACFVIQYIIGHYLLSDDGIIVFDAWMYLRHELEMLEFSIALIAMTVGPIGFAFWTSHIGNTVPGVGRERKWLIFGLIPSFLASVLIIWAAPKLLLVYEVFGEDLPVQTRLFRAHYQWVGLLPLSVLAIWLTKRSDYGYVAGLVGFVGSAVIMVYSLWAVYSPVFY
jgi:hypothetical protein